MDNLDELDDLDDVDENLLPTSLTVARVRPPVRVTMQHSASKLQVMMMKVTIIVYVKVAEDLKHLCFFL